MLAGSFQAWPKLRLKLADRRDSSLDCLDFAQAGQRAGLSENGLVEILVKCGLALLMGLLDLPLVVFDLWNQIDDEAAWTEAGYQLIRYAVVAPENARDEDRARAVDMAIGQLGEALW
ncbi:hypothetical protein ACF8FG_20965 [Pseudomonas sp. YQ_6]|uniref:hypothetical protein n=1 Tax=Pseudomonas sp. YQ_6 TaxID=3367230 RepID=UPI00370CDA8C